MGPRLDGTCLGPFPSKLMLSLDGTCFGGKINWFGPKKNSAKRRAPDLENQKSG